MHPERARQAFAMGCESSGTLIFAFTLETFPVTFVALLAVQSVAIAEMNQQIFVVATFHEP